MNYYIYDNDGYMSNFANINKKGKYVGLVFIEDIADGTAKFPEAKPRKIIEHILNNSKFFTPITKKVKVITEETAKRIVIKEALKTLDKR